MIQAKTSEIWGKACGKHFGEFVLGFVFSVPV